MEAEMTHGERVRQSQLAIAKGMKIPPENMKVLEKVKDWIAREWVYVCALEGMNIRELVDSAEGKLTVSYIRKRREEYFREKYVQESESMHSELEELQKEVEKTCEESRKVRNAVMKMLSGQERLLPYDPEKLMQDIKEKDRRIKKLEKEIRTLKENPEPLQSEQSADELEDQDNQISKKSRRSFLHFLQTRSRTLEIKKFIETYLNDEHFSKEQVEFMLECLERGMKTKDIERFAIPGLSVEMMKRLSAL